MADKLYTPDPVTTGAPGAPVRVSTVNKPVSKVIFTAGSTNKGAVYIGDSTVTLLSGQPLAPRESLRITARQIRGNSEELILSDFWIDSDTNGNKVRIAYIARR